MSFGTILSTVFIGPLKLLFEIVFQTAYRFVQHPGLSIIFLSLVMNVLVLPLYRRADAMQEAARDIDAKLRDGVAHIKKTFSGDEKMMILQAYYRQNNYKPTDALNGSVSLLLEIPFFMAAYQFLSHLEVLQNTSFGPIANLGAPDGLLVIGGLTINVLPILMTLINVIASAIYLKGFPLKTKIQLYGIAAFFLVFLYTSPSGLVFYWTLNNVFSLVKNLFYKIQNPQRVVLILTSLFGALIIVYGGFFFHATSLRRKVLLMLLGVALQLPALIVFLKSKIRLPQAKTPAVHNRKMFVIGVLFLTVLVGLLIPSTYIAASPQEFVDITYYHNPLWYLVSSASMAVGTFLVWAGVFYWLASEKGKVLFDRLVWVACGLMVVNYMFFGTKLGNLSSTLQYDTGLGFPKPEQWLNPIVLVLAAVVLWLVVVKWRKLVFSVLLTATVACGVMVGMNVVGIQRPLSEVRVVQTGVKANFNLSTEGKNIVVLFLDRAMNEYFPYHLAEKLELARQFGGFVNYTNTISFAGATNFAVPALVGGYEYTPVEINKRDTETLVSKQNEALKVMPSIFAENGYDVTVCDPPYANYAWNADISIYKGMENVKGYVTKGAFTEVDNKAAEINSNHRNFFCFSLMKTMPVVMQYAMYNEGSYNQAKMVGEEMIYTSQTPIDQNQSEGIRKKFMDSYNVLTNLSNITNITQGEQDTFLFMANDTTHEPMLLSLPDYKPAMVVNNMEEEQQNPHTSTFDGRTLEIENYNQMIHYHTGMATMLELGKWFDYLREQGVYDNTKIIIVADHGRDLGHFQDELYDGSHNVEEYMPLLLVKDFGREDEPVEYDSTFMTNADVPTLACQDAIENPVNPYTGKPINDDEKYAHPQYVMKSYEWETTGTAQNTTFPESLWSRVDANGNVWNRGSWEHYPEAVVLKEYKFPN